MIYPGPQHYWKTPKVDFHKKKKKDDEDEKPQEADDGETKLYYMDRKKTDRRAYKPMKKYIF